MLQQIEIEAAETSSMTGKPSFKDDVMAAMASVPREAFIPEHSKHLAYENIPLAIGHGQTISQPYIVALMTELLEIKPEHVILEIGTGSGYQSAVLSLLCRQVFTVERISELSVAAKKAFEKLHYDNIKTLSGNGYEGYEQQAPYDGIIVTAAATHIPEALVTQLKPGGKLVIPVTRSAAHQELLLIKKDHKGHSHEHSVLDVVFVPLINHG